jgi:hypothetical protein
MKTSNLLLLQTILMFTTLAILISGLLKLPDISLINILIRAVSYLVTVFNFSEAFCLYMFGK